MNFSLLNNNNKFGGCDLSLVVVVVVFRFSFDYLSTKYVHQIRFI